MDVFVRLVYYIEDRGEDFIHSLNILHLWIQSRKNKENSCHVIVSISGPELLVRKGVAVGLIDAIDKFVLFFACIGEEGDLDRRGGGREEGEL